MGEFAWHHGGWVVVYTGQESMAVGVWGTGMEFAAAFGRLVQRHSIRSWAL